jgi:hypothetical protein
MRDRSRPWGDQDQPDMLAVAATLHGAWTGASDPLEPEERDRLLAIVHDRLLFWIPSDGTRWHAYDEAVRALLRAVEAEWASTNDQVLAEESR